MAKVPWPDDDSDSWDTLHLGGVEFPGVAKVDVDLEEEIDVKKPKGGNGASLTRQGDMPAKLAITLRVWEPGQFGLLQDLLPTIRPKVTSAKDRKALAIKHPKCLMWGIESIAIQKIKDHSGGEGGTYYELSFDCVELMKDAARKKKATKTDKIPQFDNVLVPKPAPPAPPSKTENHP